MRTNFHEIKVCFFWTLGLLLPLSGLGLILIKGSHGEGFFALVAAFLIVPGGILAHYMAELMNLPNWVLWGCFGLTQLLYLFVLIFLLRAFNRRVNKWAKTVAGSSDAT